MRAMALKIAENFQLAPLTTFRIGGLATFFAEVNSEQELSEAIGFARKQELPIFVLGGGSNILISDQGIEGLVIQYQRKGVRVQGEILEAQAGESWDDVVALAVKHNLAGIECLAGVPGSAGGAVVQNIGAYGQTLGDAVSEVSVVELATGKLKRFSPAECEFEYRNSLFKKNPGRYLVTSFSLKLLSGGLPNISYPQVAKHFGHESTPSLAQVRDFVIRLRASKGYVIMPGFECYQTAGSFFKNPVVSSEQFNHLKPLLGEAELNRFWPSERGVKLAAAYLLERAGFSKGYREGAAGISPKHALSLVNFGQAQAREIRTLADKIKQRVWEKFGVKLEEEVLLVGKF